MFCYCGLAQIDSGDVIKGNSTNSRHKMVDPSKTDMPGAQKAQLHAIGDNIMKSGTKRLTNVK